MKNKFTLIKVGKDNYRATPQDLEFLSGIFDKRSFSAKEIDDYGIVIEEVEFSDDSMILVRIGKEDYNPTSVDLDHWRQVFEEAQNDKDFKIFTRDKVVVERVEKDKNNRNCFKIINSFDELPSDDIKNIQPIKSELNNRFWWKFPPTVAPGLLLKINPVVS